MSYESKVLLLCSGHLSRGDWTLCNSSGLPFSSLPTSTATGIYIWLHAQNFQPHIPIGIVLANLFIRHIATVLCQI